MRLRDLVLSTRTITSAVLDQAEAHAAHHQTPLVRVLVAYNVVEGRRLARLLARALHYELIDVLAIDVHPQLLTVVPRHAAEQLRVLPIGVKQAVGGMRLYLAMSDPTDEQTVVTVERATGLMVEPLVCDDSALQVALDKHYGPAVAEAPDVLVGALVKQSQEFLTESTAEALRFVHTARSADIIDEDDGPTAEVPAPRRPASLALGSDVTIETTLRRPASLALGEPQKAPSWQPPKRPQEEVPTAPSRLMRALARATASAALNERTVVPDEPPVVRHVAASPNSALAEPTRLALDDQPFEERTDPERAAGLVSPRKVIVSAPQSAPVLRAELRELIGPVEVIDDPARACQEAAGQLALVLVEPASKSALLRALLDLEELDSRPRVVLLGGDPALRMLAFVDHYADAPTDTRAMAVVILAALRQAGVDV